MALSNTLMCGARANISARRSRYCWEDAIDPEKRDIYESHFQLQTAGESVRFECKLKKPWVAEDLLRGEHIEGETWVLSAGYAVKNPDGSVRSLQGALIDISRAKWLQGFQDRRLKEAIELKRQQETFMDMVGHEVCWLARRPRKTCADSMTFDSKIRNPLSAITLCAGGILESLEQALESSPHDDVVLKRADVVSHIENSEIMYVKPNETILPQRRNGGRPSRLLEFVGLRQFTYSPVHT